MTPNAAIKADVPQDAAQLFPLTPEAVRRLRRLTERDAVSETPSRRETPKSTHADDL